MAPAVFSLLESKDCIFMCFISIDGFLLAGGMPSGKVRI
jgi:hypothetical protein